MIRLTQKEEIEPYLTDASRFHGSAEAVVLPENEKEIQEFLKEAHAKKIPVTVSGGKTGLVGGAVPLGGSVLSTEKLNRIVEVRRDPEGKDSWAVAEPGIFLKDLNQAAGKESLFYPPDPTGPKALLGGTLATNASGPNSFKYGATRRFIRAIRVVLAEGEALEIRRGSISADREGALEIPLSKRKLRAALPHYSIPRVKHAAGYYVRPGMDALDLFIGSEGTLGIITQIETALLPRPAEVLAFIAFFKSEEASWKFSVSVREESLKNRRAGAKGRLEARLLEYFDTGSLDFLRPKFPSIPKEARAALFIEQEVGATGRSPVQTEWRALFEKGDALPELWEGHTPEKEEEFRRFRSELPLSVKDFLAEHGQVKIGTDTCVPRERFEELLLFHRRKVEEIGLANVTFGHVGECHVHLNLLPRNAEEAERGRALYPLLVEKAHELGGVFSAEHGVGKLKRPYLVKLYGAKGVEEMAALKRVFDPHLILGAGNLFEIQ